MTYGLGQIFIEKVNYAYRNAFSFFLLNYSSRRQKQYASILCGFRLLSGHRIR
jgi:hypothetical protein